MTKVIQIVTDIKKGTVKSGRNAGKAFYKLFLDNGQTVFAWSWPVIKDIKKGQAAVLVLEEGKGDYLSVKESAPLAESIPSDDVDSVEEDDDGTEEFGEEDVEETEEKQVTPSFRSKKVERVLKTAGVIPYKKPKSKDEYWDDKFQLDLDKQVEIRRESCLKTAVEYASYCSVAEGQNVLTEKEIIDIAKIFEAYVTGQEEEEE